MANVLQVQQQQSILTLAKQGWSIRRIARELGIHRKTVKAYFAPSSADSNCTTNSTPGSDPKCTISTPGKPGRKSTCLPHRDWERSVADVRIHGTTKRQVLAVFAEELPFLHRLRDIRALVGTHDSQTQFNFNESHPLIRNLSEYGIYIKTHHSS